MAPAVAVFVLGALSKVDAAFIASMVSVFVSVVALSWTIYSTLRVDRARLKVEVSSAIVAPGEPEPVFIVKVTNVGKRPTQLLSLWLAFGRPYPRWRHRLPGVVRRRLPKAKRQNAIMTYEAKWAGYTTTFPMRLDVGETAQALYSDSAVREGAAKNGFTTVFGTAGGSTHSAESKVHRLGDVST